MKRNALVFFALAVTVFALASTIPVGPQQATGFISGKDTTVVLRRMYEGQNPDTWGADASPDGRYITQTDWGTGDLAVLDLLTGESRHVTAKPNGWSDDSYSESAQFSPDGLAIAYVWWSDDDYDVRIIDIDGSNERIVLPRDPDRKTWHYLHDWSPDGKHLLDYFCHRGEAGGGPCDLRLIDVKDGSTQVLNVAAKGQTDRIAGFSPDGRYVAFSMNSRDRSDFSIKDANLYVMPVDGGRVQVLLSGPQHDEFLGWSPTGGDILFKSDRDLTEGVWRLPVRDGQVAGEAELVKGGLWQLTRVGVSNGRLFYGITSQHQELFTAGFDMSRGRLTSPPATLENPPGAVVGLAAWSQDGELLAHVRYPHGIGAGDPVLVVRSVDGEQARLIPSPFTPARRIWWGTNVDRLIAHGPTASDRRWRGLSQIDLATGESSRYLKSEGVARWATLTADRKTAYYAEWNNPSPDPAHFLKRHNLVTGEVENIARLDTLLTGLMIMRTTELSSDEQLLAFQSYNRETEEWTIGVISTGTGEARELARHSKQVSDANDPDVMCRLVAWTPDGQSIVYTRAETGQRDCTIYRVPAARGEVESLGSMPSQEEVLLTPDQTRIAFKHGERRGELWMMDNMQWSSDR